MCKAAFFDAASITGAKRFHAIGTLNYRLFLNIIRCEIGSERQFGVGPFITIIPSLTNRHGDYLQREGFIPIEADSPRGEDDEALMREMCRMRVPVKEMVVVTHDSDFIFPVRQQMRARPEMRVYWVASEQAVNQYANPMVGRALRACFRSGEFTFVSLDTILPRVKSSDEHGLCHRGCSR